ncbi:MAG: hypothetical protein Q7R50_06290 [Dehalococcoidales bacterium]|nr:hypothetical protein [Dehalococcoidales bacterium]
MTDNLRDFKAITHEHSESGVEDQNLAGSPPSPMNEENRDGKTIRNRGGQPGNQNARTHGFYSKSATPEQQQNMSIAAGMEGLDEEIALLRAKISAATEDPSQSNFLLSGISLLSRLLRTREKLGSQQSKGLEQAIANVLRNVSPPVAQSMKNIIEKEEKETSSDTDCAAGPKTNPNESPAGSEKESY